METRGTCVFGFDSTGVGGWCITHRRWQCEGEATTDYKAIYEMIYQALIAETELRGQRRREARSANKPPEEAWILGERERVMREVNRLRKLLGYTLVDISTVERAERMAVGHSDYISKYAHAAADLVLRREHEETKR